MSEYDLLAVLKRIADALEAQTAAIQAAQERADQRDAEYKARLLELYQDLLEGSKEDE